MTSFSIFDTAIGPCGIVWDAEGVLGVQLPEGDARGTRARLAARFPQAREDTPPADIAGAVADIVAMMQGEARDLTSVRLDMRAIPDFNRKVFAIARGIRYGETLSYGEIAERLGDKLLARDVGQALGQNPFPIVVPCHRVLAANGRSGGFSAPGGVTTKMRMLSIERAQPGGPTLFDDLPLAVRKRR